MPYLEAIFTTVPIYEDVLDTLNYSDNILHINYILMKAFIATSIKHKEEVLRIVRILDELSIIHQCCITEIGNQEGKELFDHNVEGIKSSDIFISIFKNLGKDVSAEIGIAYGLNKKRVGINYNADLTDVMPYFAAGEIIKESELKEYLINLCKK
jgi:nucleoside 2-deoxyribosyltransferase